MEKQPDPPSPAAATAAAAAGDATDNGYYSIGNDYDNPTFEYAAPSEMQQPPLYMSLYDPALGGTTVA